MNKRVLDDRQAYFLACLPPLFASNFVSVLIGYKYSVDRGMWPLMLIIWVTVSFLYSVLALLPAHLMRKYNVPTALRHHALLGVVLAVFTSAYYLARPDWLAVNNGIRRLSPLQSVIYNDWTPWAIYLLFYLLLIGRLRKSHRHG